MTPLHLKILLHYHVTWLPYSAHDPLHAASAATREYTQQLLEKGLLVQRTDRRALPPSTGPVSKYKTSPRGDFVIKVLLATLAHLSSSLAETPDAPLD